MCHKVGNNCGAHKAPPAQDITAGGPEGARNNPRAQIANNANNPLNPMNAKDSFDGGKCHKNKHHHHHKKHKHNAAQQDQSHVAALRQRFQGLIDRVKKMLPQPPATSTPTNPVAPNKPAAPIITPPAQHVPV